MKKINNKGEKEAFEKANFIEIYKNLSFDEMFKKVFIVQESKLSDNENLLYKIFSTGDFNSKNRMELISMQSLLEPLVKVSLESKLQDYLNSIISALKNKE